MSDLYQKREVRKERSGWRDEAMSELHRQWGWDVPAVDIDFLLLEYDLGRPRAMIEYKHERAKSLPLDHMSYKAMTAFNDKAGTPLFYVRYGHNFDWWMIMGVNALARKMYPHCEHLTQRRFVELLYDFHRQPAPSNIVTLTRQEVDDIIKANREAATKI